MNSGIYLIKNMTNGKGYVGSTTDLEYRKYQHFNVLKNNKHHSPHLQYAFNKYGEKNFEFYVLAYCPENKLLEKEDFYIGYLKTLDRNNGYNINPAGRHIMSEEHKKKISEALTGRKLSPLSEEHKRKISESLKNSPLSNLNKPISKEHKRKISQTLTGRKLSPLTKEHKRKISEKLRGRNVTLMTEEIKQKISKALKRKYKERKRAPFTEEHKRKLSQALIGRKLHPLSPEHKEKISKSLRDRNNKKPYLASPALASPNLTHTRPNHKSNYLNR